MLVVVTTDSIRNIDPCTKTSGAWRKMWVSSWTTKLKERSCRTNMPPTTAFHDDEVRWAHHRDSRRGGASARKPPNPIAENSKENYLDNERSQNVDHRRIQRTQNLPKLSIRETPNPGRYYDSEILLNTLRCFCQNEVEADKITR